MLKEITENNKYTIYKHTTPSGKVYIGQTKKKPKDRWANGKGYVESHKFYNSILKYGWDNITHEILYTGLSKEEANTIEIALIKQYKQLGLSLNITDGGEGRVGVVVSEETRKKMSNAKRGKYCGVNSPSYGRKHTEEAKRKMSIAATGRRLSEETKRKVSLNHSRHTLGKHPSKETLKKLSESHKGIKHSKETIAKIAASLKGKNAKPVLLFTKDGTFVARFISAVACGEFIGLGGGSISSAIHRHSIINKKYIAIYDSTGFN